MRLISSALNLDSFSLYNRAGFRPRVVVQDMLMMALEEQTESIWDRGNNGVLVHLNQEVYGNTPHLSLATYDGMPSQGPLALGVHRCSARFRNIWVRRLSSD